MYKSLTVSSIMYFPTFKSLVSATQMNYVDWEGSENPNKHIEQLNVTERQMRQCTCD